MPLPFAATEFAFDGLDRDHPAYAQAAAFLAQRHGVTSGAVARFAQGSLPVLALGQGHVLKLFPPAWPDERAHEGRVLAHLAGRLPVGTPEVVGEGTLDGWEYLLMTRVPGRSLGELWGELAFEVRADLARQTGALLAALHALPVAGAPSALEWDTFLTGQLEGCLARQSALGLGAPWTEELGAFLAESGVVDRAPRALLHTEVMPAHLTAVADGAGWRLTGLVDFEPAMVGDPEYELASCAAFFFRREVALFDALEQGYGGFDRGWRARALAYTCLHRFAHLPRYLEWTPAPAARSFAELRAAWFGDGA